MRALCRPLCSAACRVRRGVPDAPSGPGQDAAAAASAQGAHRRRNLRPALLRGRHRLRAQNVPARERFSVLEGRGAPGAGRDPEEGSQGDPFLSIISLLNLFFPRRQNLVYKIQLKNWMPTFSSFKYKIYSSILDFFSFFRLIFF